MAYGDGPWEGSAKFVKVSGRDEVARVVSAGVNIGDVFCYALLFPATGEVSHYAAHACTRCDEAGRTEPPS